MSIIRDLLGKRIGRLVVTKKLGSREDTRGRKAIWWLCECTCGRYTEIKTEALVNKYRPTSSCGCLRTDPINKATTKHSGASKSCIDKKHLYTLWTSIKTRCYNLNSKDFQNYGGRGISLHEPWIDNFALFRNWIEINLGSRPEGYSLDRIDNDGCYKPGNLRWASRSTQANNKRRNSHCVSVAQFNLDGVWIATYASYRDAARSIGKKDSYSRLISRVANRANNIAAGYRWDKI